jgi:hypothetical protein
MKKTISVILIIILHLTFVIGHLSFAAEYMLAPNDQLEIKIISQKDLDTKQTIAPDGTISLPLLGRITAQGQTLNSFDKYLTAEFSKYVDKPQVVVYLTPRPIYVIQHDVKKNAWDVKEAKSIDEAKALAGRNYTGEIKHGDIVSVEVSEKPDFWEQNWYKIITGTAVLVGIYATLHR